MDHLQSFMSDFLSQRDCSSIHVISDNARIPQQQQEEQSEPAGRPVSRWDSGSGVSPPVRRISDGDPIYLPEEFCVGPPVRRISHDGHVCLAKESAAIEKDAIRNVRSETPSPKIPIRRGE